MDSRAALLEQTRAFGELIAANDQDAPVPTCPGWTLQQLFRHVGRGNRWAAQIIADRRVTPLDPREVRDGKPPDDAEAAIEWLNRGAELVSRAVDQVGSDGRVWTFVGPKPPGWWIRRRVHEVLVHRADAALAVGAGFDVQPDLAADAISEWLDLNCASASKNHPLGAGESLHLHALDDGLGPTGEWTVVNDQHGLSWSHSHGKGNVALRGSAKDLLLAITRRRTAGDLGLEVLGDAEVWQTWLDRTPL